MSGNRFCKITLIALISAALIGVMYLPNLLRPNRWAEIKEGLTREQVHQVLGLPNGEFLDKHYEAWQSSYIIGAVAFVVFYDNSNSKVTAIGNETYWGQSYKEWPNGYRAAFK